MELRRLVPAFAIRLNWHFVPLDGLDEAACPAIAFAFLMWDFSLKRLPEHGTLPVILTPHFEC